MNRLGPIHPHDEERVAADMARELETLGETTGVRPTSDFSDRVMAAIEREPVPQPALALGSALRRGRIGLAAAAIGDAWRVAFGGGRPFAARSQALALVLVVAVLGIGVGGAAVVGASALLSSDRSPSPSPSLPVPSPSPSTPPSPQPSVSPSPSPSASPTATPEDTETPEATETLKPAETLKPGETLRPGETLKPAETPHSGDSSGPGGGGVRFRLRQLRPGFGQRIGLRRRLKRGLTAPDSGGIIHVPRCRGAPEDGPGGFLVLDVRSAARSRCDSRPLERHRRGLIPLSENSLGRAMHFSDLPGIRPPRGTTPSSAHSIERRSGAPGKSRERGQSVVEFALVLPIMVVLLLAIVDFARIYTTMMTVESAAREAADFGTTLGAGKWEAGAPRDQTESDMKIRACIAASSLPDYVDPDADPSTGNCTNPSYDFCMTVPETGVCGPPDDSCVDPLRPEPCTVTVTLTYDFHLFAPFRINLMGRQIGLPATIDVVRDSTYAMTDIDLATPAP